MAKLLQTSITGSLTVSGSHIELPEVSGSQVVGGDGVAGQVFFDASDFKLKLKQVGVYGSFQNGTYSQFGAFSVGSSLPQCTMNSGRAGTQNDALSFGGTSAYPSGYLNVTQIYDGSSWSSGNSMIQARGGLGSGNGPSDTAVGFGGYNSGTKNCTEEYNGTSWSAGGGLITSRRFMGGTGQQNAALAQGGDYAAGCGEEYNGSSWSSGASTIIPRTTQGLAGSQNAALSAGAYKPAPSSTATNATETYDGVTWQAANCLTYCRLYSNHALAGNQDYAVTLGGQNPPLLTIPSEEWNGLTWSTGCTPNTPRRSVGTAGGGTSAVLMGGTATPFSPNIGSTCVEEYTKSFIGQDFTYEDTPASCAWGAASPLIIARREASSVGSTSAGLTFSGAGSTCTEEYNGTSWTTSGAVITPRVGEAPSGLGVQNAALGFGGYAGSPHLNNTELYNGSTWSAGNTLIVARSSGMGFGLQDAGVAAGGYGPSSPANTRITCTEEFNGTSWSASGAMITARFVAGAAGTQNAGLIYGGTNTSACTSTEEYNGTSWASGGSLITAVQSHASYGTQNAASQVGGYTNSFTNISQLYDGSSWTSGPNIITTRGNFDGAGDQTSAYIAGGYTPSTVACVEEFSITPATYTQRTIPFCLGTWSGAANMAICVWNHAGAGTQNSTVSFGGMRAPGVMSNCTEEYNGTSWSPGGAMITARCDLGGLGTQNAALAAGGLPASAPGCVEEYDGSAWSAATVLTCCRRYPGAAGTQNAGLIFGGYFGGNLTSTEEYNGTSWSTGGSLNSARYNLAGTGIQNAALAFGGQPGTLSCTEEYNGSTWATGGALNIGRTNLAGAGEVNAGLAFGGATYTLQTEQYNGTSWSFNKPMNAIRAYNGGAGSSTQAISFGGTHPSCGCFGATEEYTYGTYCVGAWSVGGAVINNRLSPGAAGNKNAGLVFGGANPGATTATEEYDGASWSSGGSLITAREQIGGTGTQSAALGITGVWNNATEEYDGSTWASGGNVIYRRRAMGTAGTTNAGLVFGGACGNAICSATEEYDGSSWSSATSLPHNQAQGGGGGTQNAAWFFAGICGSQPSTPITDLLVEYNGSSWSYGPDGLTGVSSFASAGNQSCHINFGGSTPTYQSLTQEYNGLGWSTGGNLISKLNNHGGRSTSIGEAFASHGNNSPSVCQNNSQDYSLNNPVNQGWYCLTKTLSCN